MNAEAGQVMERMVAAFATGDVDDVEAYVAESYFDHQGLGSPVTGPSGFRGVVQAARSIGSLEVWIEDLVVGDYRAAARIRWRRTSPNAEVVERETIDIVRVESGRAVEHWGAESWRRTVPPATGAV